MVRQLTAAALMLAFACATVPARASIVITALDATTSLGGSGTFDVTIQNTGPADVNLGGFQLELSVSSASGITFTDATIDTAATYVFAGATSTPPLSFDTFPNTDFIASDLSTDSLGYQTIGANMTYGLAHVSFSVASDTPLGPIQVTILPFDSSTGGGTYLSDVDSNMFDYTPTNGTIQVNAPVPEPSTLLLAGIGGGFLLLPRLRFGSRENR